MAKRLISLRDLDALEGLVTRHYKLQERLEGLEAEAAAYDLSPTGVADLRESLEPLRRELKTQLEILAQRLDSPRR